MSDYRDSIKIQQISENHEIMTCKLAVADDVV